jgi:ribosome-binding protein aMBF1 (putative translation factor)
VPSSAGNKSNKTSNATPSDRNSALKRRRSRSSAAQFLYDRYVGDDSNRKEEYEREALNSEIARKIYALRTKAGLSQRDLARMVGTSASAICRLEDADYDGHSLSLLKRIADALGKRIEVRFAPAKRIREA